MRKKIKLINGPYNNRVIEDSGTVLTKMWISTNGDTPGAEVGVAIYEPNEKRDMAFWLDNKWEGTLEEVIPCEREEKGDGENWKKEK